MQLGETPQLEQEELVTRKVLAQIDRFAYLTLLLSLVIAVPLLDTLRSQSPEQMCAELASGPYAKLRSIAWTCEEPRFHVFALVSIAALIAAAANAALRRKMWGLVVLTPLIAISALCALLVLGFSIYLTYSAEIDAEWILSVFGYALLAASWLSTLKGICSQRVRRIFCRPQVHCPSNEVSAKNCDS